MIGICLSEHILIISTVTDRNVFPAQFCVYFCSSRIFFNTALVNIKHCILYETFVPSGLKTVGIIRNPVWLSNFKQWHSLFS